MSMRIDSTLSAEHQAKLASALVDAAVAQQEKVESLLNALDRGTTDMPNKIAQQAAQEVVQKIADLVTRKVADVLQPAEAKAETLLKAMEDEVAECRRAVAEYRRAAAEYRRAGRNAVLACIIASSCSAVLILVMMRMAGIV
jgi:predicted esterase YcpF (UPF0227 family)